MQYELIYYAIPVFHTSHEGTEKKLLGVDVNLTGAYAFDCTFVRLICLTAKALRRITMLGFLAGATEPDKRTLKRVQLQFQG